MSAAPSECVGKQARQQQQQRREGGDRQQGSAPAGAATGRGGATAPATPAAATPSSAPKRTMADILRGDPKPEPVKAVAAAASQKPAERSKGGKAIPGPKTGNTAATNAPTPEGWGPAAEAPAGAAGAAPAAGQMPTTERWRGRQRAATERCEWSTASGKLPSLAISERPRRRSVLV